MIKGSLASHIGDPTFVAWLTVLIYFLATLRCVYKAIECKKVDGNYQFWLFLAVFLFSLGINKQLDMQTWFEQAMKAVAEERGWYAHKALLQKGFIAFLGIGMLTILISFRFYLANAWRHYTLTWIGIALLCLFILMRAATFNRLDVLVSHDVLGFDLTEILEISAILLIMLSTFVHSKQFNRLTADTLTIKGDVEIKDEHAIVQCPKCGIQPLSKAVDGRLYKCRACGFKYRITIAN